MPSVTVQTTNGSDKSLPVFHELAQKFHEVRERAFALFESRGRQAGACIEDWLKAEREILGAPPAELTEEDGRFELQVALPGFDPKDVEVTATPIEIIVHASSRQEKKSEKNTVLWTEFTSNDVFRQVQIPKPIDAAKATAMLDHGVLRVAAPKAVGAEKQAAAVKAA